MSLLCAVLVLLALVVLAGSLSRRAPAVPLPLVQMALGAALAWWWGRRAGHAQLGLDPQVFMLLFIPPLLYGDGWAIPKREFGLQSLPLLLLSIGLVLATTLVGGMAIAWLLPDLPRPLGFLLAAALSPTDAVAIAAIVRRHRMPHGVLHMLEGESLTNDATALVAVKFALAAVAAQQFSLAGALSDLLFMAAGGMAIGLLCAGAAHLLQAAMLRGREHQVDLPAVLFLLLVPYPPYLLAEHFHCSGVLAAACAGIGSSLLAVRSGGGFNLSHGQTQGAAVVLRYALDGLVFLLLGMQLADIVHALPAQLNVFLSPGNPLALRLWGSGLAIALLLLAIRFAGFMVVGRWGIALVNRWRRSGFRPLSATTAAVATLGGARGALSLVAVLGVPLVLADGSPFPRRGLLVFMAGLAVVASLVLTASLLPPLLRRLAGSATRDESHQARERAWARRRGARAALRTLDTARGGGQDETVPDGEGPGGEGRADARAAACARVEHSYRQRMLPDEPGSPHHSAGYHLPPVEWQLRLRLLQVERAELHRLCLRHRINDDTLRALTHELDLVETVLRHRA